jgi:putative transcriptional regulator
VLLAYDSRVREARLRAGLSQEALAREVGVSRQTIVNIERGDSEPKVLLAIAIAIAVGLGAAAVGELFRRGGAHEH